MSTSWLSLSLESLVEYLDKILNKIAVTTTSQEDLVQSTEKIVGKLRKIGKLFTVRKQSKHNDGTCSVCNEKE